MATQSEHWQAYLKAHSLIFDYEEEHGLLSAKKFKAKFDKVFKNLINVSIDTIDK
jgi:hypothetical protein